MSQHVLHLDWPLMLAKAGFASEHASIEPTPVQVPARPSKDRPNGGWQPGRLMLTAFTASVPQ